MTMTIGERLPARDFGPVTRTDIVRYQGASGDFHPLHHDDAFARAAGFPGAFAVGMLHAGYLGTYCAQTFGADHVRRFRVRFREQVWPDDTLTCTATVSSMAALDPADPAAPGHRVTLDLAATRQTGGVAATGTAEVVISD
jgi:acyl dehydratase